MEVVFSRAQWYYQSNHSYLFMQDFVDSFNNHRRKFFNPGSSLTVDESFAEWNGVGGSWINIGLPMYMSLDRKPHDGCEIQDAADGDSGVLLCWIIVKSPDEVAKQQREAPKPWHDFNITHGGKVLISLVEPWLDTGHIVVGHSAFASVRTTEMLEERNTGFLGSIKQATTGFPMKFLSTMETGGSRRGKFNLTNERHCFGQLCLTISTVTESKVLVRKTGERVDMMDVMTVEQQPVLRGHSVVLQRRIHQWRAMAARQQHNGKTNQRTN